MTPWFSGDFQSIFGLVVLKSLLEMTRQSSRGKISNFVPKASESEFYISNVGYYSCLLIIKKRKTQQQKTNKQKTCRLAAVSMMRSLQTCLFFNVTKMEDVTCSPYCEQAPLMSV